MVTSMLSDEAHTIDAETSWLALLSLVWLKPESKAMPGMYLSILEWIKSINTKHFKEVGWEGDKNVKSSLLMIII